MLLDHGSFVERDAGLQSVDPLGFVDQKAYPDRVAAAQLATGMRDAAVWGTGTIDGRPVAICVMDFGFMGGSMGAVVGEKVTRAAEHALAERVPLIVVSASGGARMQEGTLALMQLAKTVARARAAARGRRAVHQRPHRPDDRRRLRLVRGRSATSTSPSRTRSSASPAPASRPGTIAQELPPGFQRSEFLFEHGFLDRVVHRSELRAELAALLRYLVPAAAARNGDERRTASRSACRRSGRCRSSRTSPSGSCRPSREPPPPTNGNGGASPKPRVDAGDPAAGAGRAAPDPS